METKNTAFGEGKFGKWGDALYAAILAARLGREVLLKYNGNLHKIEKKFQAGLVSEADKESERAIFDFLRKKFPQDEFLGEESAHTQTRVQAPVTGPHGRWVVDPLDGTTNYIHQFPIYCVSIGYEVNGQTQVAVVDVPALGEVYTAVRGCGAFVNGKKISVSQTGELSEAFLATGFFNEVEERLQEQLKLFGKIIRECRAVRRAGAAAYDLCLVARGVFDGYWEKGIQPWDSAAGMLLVEEAGGIVTTYEGGKYTPYSDSIIAANPKISAHLINSLR
jgi:myo-inositol-1(or 4)-monophosphatase